MSDKEIEFQKLLKYGIENKPNDLIISDLKWKYLVRCVLRAENILMIGPTGCAKTMAAKYVAKVLKRPFFKFNIGSTQDARATLVGNTFLHKGEGTVFHKSPFVNAIMTPNAVILLDELTRGTHDAWNILMPVTDPTQRDLQLDEDVDGSVIKVADGVCFVATANIGNEYTATKVMDKALSNRFPIKVEMEPLDVNEMKDLLSIIYKGASKSQFEVMDKLAEIIEDIRVETLKDDKKLTTSISVRSLVHMAKLVLDGFTLKEICEMAIYTEYVDMDERVYVKSVVQSYIPVDVENPVKDPRNK